MAAKKKEAPKKEAPKKEAPEKEPKVEEVPEVVDSVTPQERAFPTGFVRITKGDHKGVYGSLLEVKNNEKGEPYSAIVRSRDADHALYSVEYDSLEAAEAGGR